jgi:hypothetical protein
MPRKLVDVFDREGGKLFTYAIALEDEGCLEGEFEEVALIFAESSGLVAAEEIVHIRARCDSVELEALATAATAVRPKRQETTVVSLIKHRMKRRNGSRATPGTKRLLSRRTSTASCR